MAVVVSKLEGEDIPVANRQAGAAEIFRVTDDDGAHHYFADEVEAARKAVELSEAQKQR